MNVVSINIRPVANGWIVNIIAEPGIMYSADNLMGEGIKHAIEAFKGSMEDPMLRPKKEEPETDPDKELKVRRDPSTYIFIKFEDALQFLRYKIDQ